MTIHTQTRLVRRENRRDVRQKCNSFENYRVAHHARPRLRAGISLLCYTLKVLHYFAHTVILLCNYLLSLVPFSATFESSYCFLNPLTAGAVHIRFLHFLLAHYISAFKPVTDKT